MFRRRGKGKSKRESEHTVGATSISPAPKPEASPHGKQIVIAHPDRTFTLDEAALTDLLLQKDIKDRPVVVISITGEFRKGKSFLLGHFLKYLRKKYGMKISDENDYRLDREDDYRLGREDDYWMGRDDEPLEGFSWRGGSERDTAGIVMWSEIFKATMPNGKKVAIILLDTQGSFDSESTMRDCATVFALSTMLSSVQIYNISSNIQEDHLQHLQLFTDYGKLALRESGTKLFQKLKILVRDWSFPYEAPYGAEGGMKILQRRLKITDNQDPDMQTMRKDIMSCFSTIDCFLMPHPGLFVATNENFNGMLREIEPEFKNSLEQLAPLLLAPRNLIPKLINEEEVTAKDFLQLIKSYMDIFKGDELPEPKTMLVATAQANNLTAAAEAKEVYIKEMEEICGGGKPYLRAEKLEAAHCRVFGKALDVFLSKKKMGGEKFSQSYREALINDLGEEMIKYRARNKSKHIFKGFLTPLVLGVILVVTKVLSGLFDQVFGPISTFFNLFFVVTLVVFIVWCYTRCSGKWRAFGIFIDAGATKIWDNIIEPLYQRMLLKEAARAKRAEDDVEAPPNEVLLDPEAATHGQQKRFGRRWKWLPRQRNVNRAG